jgi:hypothetical protein
MEKRELIALSALVIGGSAVVIVGYVVAVVLMFT